MKTPEDIVKLLEVKEKNIQNIQKHVDTIYEHLGDSSQFNIEIDAESITIFPKTNAINSFIDVIVIINWMKEHHDIKSDIEVTGAIDNAVIIFECWLDENIFLKLHANIANPFRMLSYLLKRDN